MIDSAARTRPAYVRDRFTWLAFFMLGYYSAMQATLGPIMPFLREELGLNYSMVGLHISAMAVGMILAGLTSQRLVSRFGRHIVFWVGSAGMAAGALLVSAGRTPLITIGGALVLGWLGSLTLSIIPAALSDHHATHRATAVTESNVAASVATILPPILIGVFAATAITWRGAFWVQILLWGGAWLVARRIPVPEPVQPASDAPAAPLPRQFWLVLAVMFLVVSAEWSVVAWSADFLAGPVGLDTSLAASLMSAYFLAMVIGRFVGSRLTRRLPSRTLLPIALGLALAGFLLQWLGPVPAVNVIGLFAAGLGVANLFPQSLAWLTTLAGDQTGRAGALASFICGFSILIAPQLLGALADVAGMQAAMGLVPVILIAAMAMTVLARRG